jgi:hypothetical protein
MCLTSGRPLQGGAVSQSGAAPGRYKEQLAFSNAPTEKALGCTPRSRRTRPHQKAADVLEAWNSVAHAYAAGKAYFRADAAAASRHLTALLEQQRVDGGWPVSANLRVTDPDCACPWECGTARSTLIGLARSPPPAQSW